jgi:predicted transcriptional regulator
VPPKAVIETEQELDEYLAAVKKAFAAELRKGRRITL